jgi:hypothetical protein
MWACDRRLLSIRAYDQAGMMLEADVVDGRELSPMIDRMFAIAGVDYLHAHFARRGCYAARVDRA